MPALINASSKSHNTHAIKATNVIITITNNIIPTKPKISKPVNLEIISFTINYFSNEIAE